MWFLLSRPGHMAAAHVSGGLFKLSAYHPTPHNSNLQKCRIILEYSLIAYHPMLMGASVMSNSTPKISTGMVSSMPAGKTRQYIKC